MDYYYSFNQYLKEKFGQRVQRISLDAGFSCPNIDGTLSDAGCIFCNNKAFGVYAQSNLRPDEQIDKAIAFYERRLGVKKFIAYFQSFSSTHGSIAKLKKEYEIIRKYPQIIGLFVSTRPDCVDEEKIKLLNEYKRDYLVWVEYGLQTTNDKILKIINRNHTYKDFLKALALTRRYDIDTAVHIILGLPQQALKDVIIDAKNISRLDIQGIKFHILHVVKNTSLEKTYERGEIKLLSQREYVTSLCDFMEIVPPKMVVMRVVSDSNPQYLIAPNWINDKPRVIKDIEDEFKRRGTKQGSKYLKN